MGGPSPSPTIEDRPGEAPAPTTPAPDDLLCPGCDYDLRGIESDRCPECGLAVDRTVGVSRIPWAHRRRIGRARAYWRTVWLATFRTRRLAAEVDRRVDYRDAQRFRLVTVAITTLALLGVLGAAVAVAGGVADLTEFMPSGPDPFVINQVGVFDAFLPWAAGAIMPPVLPLAIVLFVLMVTGVASYWFHPRSLPVARQNRAVALSYYASAPLVFLWVPAVVTAALLLLARQGAAGRVVLLVELLDMLLVPLVLLALYVATLRMLRLTTGSRKPRMVVAAVVVPLSWGLSALLTLALLPWLVGFVWLVIDSLR